jgi:hypothetical protein
MMPRAKESKAVTILIIGNPVYGFGFIGPFKDNAEAAAYGDQHVDDEFWVVELMSPDHYKDKDE